MGADDPGEDAEIASGVIADRAARGLPTPTEQAEAVAASATRNGAVLRPPLCTDLLVPETSENPRPALTGNQGLRVRKMTVQTSTHQFRL